VQDSLSLSEALIAPQVGRNDVLERLFGQVKWYRFEKPLARLKPESAGRPRFDPLVMFKALLLQQWCRLSDAELEEALNDRLSFRRFLNFRWRMPHPITPRFAVSVTGWSKRS
jgi:transposase, IS5 family